MCAPSIPILTQGVSVCCAQASQGGFQDARAALGGLKPDSPDKKDSKRLSFHNHPGELACEPYTAIILHVTV